MSANFQYVPLAPDALSGPAFISQTERAFNELGGGIDAVNDTASQALNISGNAHTAATEALATANNAASEAANAGNAAAGAFAVAKSAQQRADAAQGRADNAFDLAADAKSTADIKGNAAQAAADAAFSAAETARTTADAATTEAVLARGTVQEVQNLAAEANGEFRRVDPDKEGVEALNADTYPNPAKVYFDGMSSVSGLPDGFANKGGYLKVYAVGETANGRRILQIFYAPDGSQSFRREGKSRAVEGDIEVTIWDTWLPSVPDAVVTMGPDGTIPGDVLPGDVVRSVNGKIDPSLLPSDESGNPATSLFYQVSNTEPEDTTRLWIRGTDSTAYYHTGAAWKPIVGVYAETTTP